nr:MAG TPA: hypothetical protein [Caudoviricetes sp.]
MTCRAPGSASAGRGFCFACLSGAPWAPLGRFWGLSGTRIWVGC